MVVQVLCVQIQSPENIHHMEMGGLDIFRCVLFFFVYLYVNFDF